MRRVKKTPIGTDAAFHRLPRLIDRFNDVVVDAIGLGASNEITDYSSLLEMARLGLLEIVTSARPAEFGDHNALAGMDAAQPIIDVDCAVDRLAGVGARPIRQNMSGDEIDRGRELRMVDPLAPDFTRGDRHRALALDALDDLDELVRGQVGTQQCFVADKDRVDVAVMAGE